MMKFDFSGQTAIVIGGTSGIGLEVARQLSLAGAKTFISARNAPKEAEFAQFIPCDVRKEQDVQNLVDQVIGQEAKIDILVNTLAINYCKRIEDVSLEEWEDVMATNMTGIFLACKMVLPHMKKAKSGKIVNMSSIAGRYRSPVAGVHYVASKAAIIGFSKQLAFETASLGIQVNTICPSQTMTPMLREGMSQDQIKNLESRIPLGRIADVKEQAEPVLFLCSDASSYMTGAVLDVNGGQI